MGIESKEIKALQKKVSVDGNLTPLEKQAFLDAFRKDKKEVLKAMKSQRNELRDFIMQDFAQRSYELVGKQGVQLFQQKMGINPDGVYGPDTFQKITRYQEKNGLTVDGIIGPKTLASLGVSTSNQEVQNSQTSPEKKKSFFQKLFGNTTEGKSLDIPNDVVSPVSKSELREIRKYFKNKDGGDLDRAIRKFQKISGITVTGEIDSRLLNAVREAKKLPYSTPMTESDIKKMNNGLKRAETGKGVENLSESWKTIYKEFFLKLNSREQREVLGGNVPIALANSRNNKLIYIYKGKVQKEVNVIFGYGGFVNGSVSGKGKTPRKVVSKFYGANIPSDAYGKAANNPRESPTVLGAAILSPQGAAGGGKWFHGVADGRMQSMRNGTAGCVGMNVYDARMIAFQVMKSKKGFGYVS